MKAINFSVYLCACCLAATNVAAGEIIGRVEYPAGIDGRRSPAVVYLVSDAPISRSAAETIVVDQRNLQFVPRVQAMALGGSIVFHNSDSEAHNVNSQSGCCAFNFMIAPASATGPGQSDPFSPEKAGLIRLLCNIHSQMRGFVMVCPNPMYAVADAQGNFRIRDVPEGTYKLLVWQESSQQYSRQIEMANEARLHIRLEAAEANKGVSGSVPGRPVLPWRQVLRQIAGKLEAAADMARKTASVSDADQLALDAYFECFEASELETAVLLFRGEERKFALERKFAAIRRPLLADLAAGRTDMEHARAAIHELVAAIEVDIAALYDQGVVDRTALGSTPGTAKRITSQVGSTDVSAVMVDLRRAFEEVSKFADQGNSSAAAGALADAYFHVFHRIEPALASTNYVQMRQIENRFLELRGSIRSGLTPESVRTNLDALWAQIDVAATALRRSNQTGFTTAANRFWNAFIILSREGVEALLIITALLLYLDRCQRPQAKRLIYVGILLGVLATLVTWSGLQWVIAQSGVAQETIEGVSALAAGAVLFYVSYWLVSKSEARQWQQFLARQVDRHLTTGSRWAIGLAAFLAVYREGAETILMFQPMLVQPTAQELTGAIAGVGAAIVALAAVFWGLRFASFRLAIRPFFRVTGVLLFTLAIVFAGKGIAELQEARVLTVSPLPLPLHRFVMGIPSALRDALGITANVQALAIQATILSGVLLSLLSMWLMAPRTPEGDGRRIVQPSRTENECATSAL